VLNITDISPAQLASGNSSSAFCYLNDGKGHFQVWIPNLNGQPIPAAQLHILVGALPWSSVRR
jgi:hypothetical protein